MKCDWNRDLHGTSPNRLTPSPPSSSPQIILDGFPDLIAECLIWYDSLSSAVSDGDFDRGLRNFCRASLCGWKLVRLKHPLAAVISTDRRCKLFDLRVEAGVRCFCCVWGFKLSAVSQYPVTCAGTRSISKRWAIGIDVAIFSFIEVICTNSSCCVHCVLYWFERCKTCRNDGWVSEVLEYSSLNMTLASLKPLNSRQRSEH